MKIIKEINKLMIVAVSPINLTLVNESSLSLFINIASTPKMGIKSNDINNICKKNVPKG